MGEAGVVPAPAGYLAAARALCDKHGALLALDEVQTGVGRTGHWFAYQAEGVAPDVITLAKGLGGGLPIGAMIAFADGAFTAWHPGGAAALFQPGHHGTTFGGNPVACAAALAVLRTIAADGLLDHVKRVGERLRRGILGLPHVADVRGAGLLLGIVLGEPAAGDAAASHRAPNARAAKGAPSAAQVANSLREKGFLVNAAQPDTIRIAPPLILTNAQADAFIVAIAEVLEG
jgi:acetylornithine aminotransferase